MPEVFASEPLSRSFWRGTQPLWKAFWLVYVAGHVVFGVVVQQGVMWAMQSRYAAVQRTELELLDLVANCFAVLFVVLALFFVACAVAVWRCSGGDTFVVWRWCARAVLAVHGLLLVVVGMALGYLLSYGWEASLNVLMSL